MKARSKKQEKKRRITAFFILLFCVCAAFITEMVQAGSGLRTDGFAELAGIEVRESLYKNVVDYFLPVTGYKKQERSVSQVILDLVLESFPVYTYAAQGDAAGMSGSDFEAELEQQLAAQLAEENEAWSAQDAGPEESGAGQQDGSTWAQDMMQQSFLYQMQGESAASREKTLFSYATEKAQQVDLEALSDYATLVKKHYVIDATTGSNQRQLNVRRLLKKDLTLDAASEGPQILIYHTHSLEGYKDSKAGDLNESVVGLGDYLTEILTERYGLRGMHDRGTCDADRDRAYGVAGPALEKILEENPSIEVVIDLHRDGVAEDTYLLTEVNDTVMAPLMFFNGLSYTNKNGKLDSLKNPNLQTNLAFSLQMELLASEYYPGLSRGIYLKGLRYNLHYCPKSLLVEVGAQTNTLQEAMNTMPPLADILNRVLSGEKP